MLFHSVRKVSGNGTAAGHQAASNHSFTLGFEPRTSSKRGRKLCKVKLVWCLWSNGVAPTFCRMGLWVKPEALLFKPRSFQWNWTFWFTQVKVSQLMSRSKFRMGEELCGWSVVSNAGSSDFLWAGVGVSWRPANNNTSVQDLPWNTRFQCLTTANANVSQRRYCLCPLTAGFGSLIRF